MKLFKDKYDFAIHTFLFCVVYGIASLITTYRTPVKYATRPADLERIEQLGKRVKTLLIIQNQLDRENDEKREKLNNAASHIVRLQKELQSALHFDESPHPLPPSPDGEHSVLVQPRGPAPVAGPMRDAHGNVVTPDPYEVQSAEEPLPLKYDPNPVAE